MREPTFKYNLEDVNKSRYERKFYILGMDKNNVEMLVKLNPSAFSEIYFERKVNSVYLDTVDLDSYFDNTFGSDNRVKVRIRWYGDILDEAKDPNLEIKVKAGLMGRKIIFPVKGFDLMGNVETSVRDTIKNSRIPDLYKNKIGFLKPQVLISYDRKYFLSADGGFRLTIDSNLNFYKLGEGFKRQRWNQEGCIVELKYNLDEDTNAKYVFNSFPFRLSRSSKYVMGVQKIFGDDH